MPSKQKTTVTSVTQNGNIAALKDAKQMEHLSTPTIHKLIHGPELAESGQYFWGCELQGKKSEFEWKYPTENEEDQEVYYSIDLSRVVLGQTVDKGINHIIELETTDHNEKPIKHVIANLTDNSPYMNLQDMCLENAFKLRLLEGTGPVSLTGIYNINCMGDEDAEISEDEDDEEEDEDDGEKIEASELNDIGVDELEEEDGEDEENGDDDDDEKPDEEAPPVEEEKIEEVELEEEMEEVVEKVKKPASGKKGKRATSADNTGSDSDEGDGESGKAKKGSKRKGPDTTSPVAKGKKGKKVAQPNEEDGEGVTKKKRKGSK